MTAWVAVSTVVVLLFYLWASIWVGRGRQKYGIAAPAMTGHPEFERAVRVQANTLEWLVIFLPAMWLFSFYVHALTAALLGLVWVGGRIVYARAYAKDPATRSTGFLIQFIATAIALVGALAGAMWSIVVGGAGA
jgi:uncharacterized membrane protein YecN with MAPEG domain